MEMFYAAPRFNSSLEGWDTSSVKDMEAMFANAYAFNQPLASWNTSSVTYMRKMFATNKAFNQPLLSWNTASVKDMSKMFYGANAFVKYQSIESWETSGANKDNVMVDVGPEDIGRTNENDYVFFYYDFLY